MAADDAPDEVTQQASDDWNVASIGLGARMGRYELRALLGAGGMGVVFEASDPDLDRAVAVKILRAGSGTGDDLATARLRREGVTMARLTHPNVIRVYDVGEAHGHAFVAMELVRGGTLADWLARAPRTPDEVIAVFVHAGRGLAAAHDAGLVHRDFKPQNVLVGDDGRVLVTDFGLARVAAAAGGQPAGDAAAGEPVTGRSAVATITHTGEIAGTPAYMAPEQLGGGPVDARADQYSFCVALWRALFGAAPHDGETAVAGAAPTGVATLAAPEQAVAARVPARVRAALERGLDAAPARRFPSMHELLAELAPLPARARPAWWAMTAAVAAVAGGAVWVASGDGAAPDPCPAPTAALAAVWSDGRSRALHDHLVAVDPAHGAARHAAALRTVAPFAAAWGEAHVATCRQTRVHGKQSDTLLDLRMRCLDRRLAELDGSLALLASADSAAQLDGALAGLVAVTPVTACDDDAALGRQMTLPTDPDQRRTVEELSRRIQQAEVEQRADRLVGLPARTAELVALARRTGHAPTLAAALATEARVEMSLGRHEAAAAALRELTQLAATVRDDRTEAFAWIHLIAVVGGSLFRRDEALTLVPAATAAILRAGDPVDLRTDLLVSEAQILWDGPQVQEALAKLALARRLLEEAGAAGGGELGVRLADVLSETGSALGQTRDQAASVASYREAIARFRALYGPDSMDEAVALHNIGETLWRSGDYEGSLAALRDAARINRARAGASPRLAGNLASMARAHGRQGRWDDALTTYGEALAMYRAVLGADDVSLVPVLVGLASALGNADRFDDAERTYGELIALIERTGATTNNLPIAFYNRGELNLRRGRCDAAITHYRRSAELFEAIEGERSIYVVYPLVGLGQCLVQLGRAAEAIAPLERASAVRADGGDALQMARARRWLGRALVETRRDRARGLALAHEARAALATAAATDPSSAAELRELDAWLAARR